MRKLTKTCVSKERIRKRIVFGILMLCIGGSIIPQIQSTVQANLADPAGTVPYLGSPPMILLLYPNEGDIVTETYSLRWTAQDAEDGINLSIYFYLSNNNSANYTAFWNNPYENSGELQWNTTQYSDGDYTLLVEVQDSDGHVGVDSCTFQIQNYKEQSLNNAPMKPDQPFGRVYDRMGQEYSYSTSTTDPDGNLMYYLWDWGDGTNSGWLGPYHSGVNCEAQHAWMEIGPYNILVKAKDVSGIESVWSDPLCITIPYSYKPLLQFLELVFQQFPFAFPFLQKLLGY